MDSAHIAPKGRAESVKTYRHHIYEVLFTLMQTETKPNAMRIERLWPETDWATLWRNLQADPVSEALSITMYNPHSLYRTLPNCDRKDTLRRRFTECGDGRIQWEWSRQRVALTLLDPRWITEDWLLRTQFKFWSLQRHRSK